MPATITERIALDLRQEIARKGSAPAGLTLTSLARHYAVSLTPVRLAVNALIEEGLIRKRENGRLEVRPRAGPLPEDGKNTDWWEHPAAGWEEQLVAEIMRRSLRGESGYLREQTVAQQYGIGRTILRQAFTRLAGKGVLEHVPRCGWRVRVLDEADMNSYLVAREAMELAALELAWPHLEAADLQKMMAGNLSAAGDAARLDNQLHRYLIEKARNRYFREFFERHGPYYTFLFDYAAPEAHVLDEMAAQHRTILAALLAGDLPAARAALSHHIRSQQPVVSLLMKTLSARPVLSHTASEDGS